MSSLLVQEAWYHLVKPMTRRRIEDATGYRQRARVRSHDSADEVDRRLTVHENFGGSPRGPVRVVACVGPHLLAHQVEVDELWERGHGCPEAHDVRCCIPVRAAPGDPRAGEIPQLQAEQNQGACPSL